MNSIRSRLNAGLAISLVVVFVLIGLGASVSFRFLTEAYIDSRLEHDTESILTALHFPQADAGPMLRAGRIDPIYHRAYSGHYYRIDFGKLILRSRSLWDDTLKVNPAAPGEKQRFRLQGPEGQLLLVRVAGFRTDGRELSIAVAEDLTPIRADVRRFQFRFVIASIAALIILLSIQRLLLRRGFRPVGRVRDEIHALAQGQRRHLSEEVPAEIQPLVREINRLLEATERRLRRSRNALGNLAHTLKTPLTLLAHLAERPELAHCEEIRTQLREHVKTIGARMDRELKRARLAGGATGGARLDLAQEVAALLSVLDALYRDKGLRMKNDVPPGLMIVADREDFLELLGNLLDNACKWAQREVRIQAEREAQFARIRIEDDGPGRGESELEPLQQRGMRGAGDTVPGHGLGLAIAHDVVEQYGGTLTLGRSERLGGFQVDVRVPLWGGVLG